MKNPKPSSSGSTKSFEETQFQVTRLMEVAGGSANAYDEPPVSSNPNEPTVSVEGNPFAEEDKSPPAHGLVVEDEPINVTPASNDEARKDFEAHYAQHTQLQPGWCGTRAPGDYEEDDLLFVPENIDPNTYDFFKPVEDCGELEAIWEAFSDTLACEEGGTAQLETGPATFKKNHVGCWILDDPVKNKRYLQETGNLRGELAEGQNFLWVMSLDEQETDFGYIHDGYVFLVKEEKP